MSERKKAVKGKSYNDKWLFLIWYLIILSEQKEKTQRYSVNNGVKCRKANSHIWAAITKNTFLCVCVCVCTLSRSPLVWAELQRSLPARSTRLILLVILWSCSSPSTNSVCTQAEILKKLIRSVTLSLNTWHDAPKLISVSLQNELVHLYTLSTSLNTFILCLFLRG